MKTGCSQSMCLTPCWLSRLSDSRCDSGSMKQASPSYKRQRTWRGQCPYSGFTSSFGGSCPGSGFQWHSRESPQVDLHCEIHQGQPPELTLSFPDSTLMYNSFLLSLILSQSADVLGHTAELCTVILLSAIQEILMGLDAWNLPSAPVLISEKPVGEVSLCGLGGQKKQNKRALPHSKQTLCEKQNREGSDQPLIFCKQPSCIN